MDFEYTDKTQALIGRMQAFMDEHIYPAETEYQRWVNDPVNVWQPWPRMEELRAKAREAGLWNLFLPREYGELSPGLSNLEYASLAELTGRVQFSPEVFNCNAPDSGNMEVLAKYGSEEQKRRWLSPLLAGEIRSAFLMTEPRVASSDATNIETSIVRDGDEYVINGLKWWITGIMTPLCKVLIVMGRTENPDAPQHQQHTMILVPRDAPGVHIVRPLTVFNSLNSPYGQAEVLLENVRVPKENLILGEGRGFEVAQGRLGPGRIHHCMRQIGAAQRALELMSQRAEQRTAFGCKLSEQGVVRQDIARSFCEIEQARLLTLKAASYMDSYGGKGARDLIAAIKIVAPQMAQTVIDRAMQVFGGMGFCQDTPLADFFRDARYLRMADGPDEVHLAQLGKLKIREYAR